MYFFVLWAHVPALPTHIKLYTAEILSMCNGIQPRTKYTQVSVCTFTAHAWVDTHTHNTLTVFSMWLYPLTRCVMRTKSGFCWVEQGNCPYKACTQTCVASVLPHFRLVCVLSLYQVSKVVGFYTLEIYYGNWHRFLSRSKQLKHSLVCCDSWWPQVFLLIVPTKMEGFLD